MSLSFVATVLLVPPVSLLFLAIAGFLLRRRWLVGLALAGLLVLALPVVAQALLVSLAPAAPPPGPPPGAIVVLGGDVTLSGDGPPRSRIGPLTLERVRRGAELARETGLPLLVTGGLVGAEPVPVGLVMADSLRQDFGVPVRWVEGASRDTWENARFSAALLRASGIDRVLLVSQPWHLRRGMLAFARAGIAAIPAPTAPDRLPPLGWREFIPAVAAWQRSYFALHEWIGLGWYRARSWL